MRGLARAQSITTVSKQFSTNPFENLKPYNPFEKQQNTDNERKESEEIEHDQARERNGEGELGIQVRPVQ